MRAPIALTSLILLAAACASDPESAAVDPEAGLAPDDVGSFDDEKADLGAITWVRPEAPRTFVIGEPHPASIDYSQCYAIEDPSADLAVQCDPARSEVEWFRVDPADVEAAFAEGLRTFVVRVDPQIVEDSILLRASIHAVDAEGDSMRLASRPQLLSGDVVSEALDAPAELYVFIGKGRTLIGPWSTGTINFVVTPYFE